VDRQVYNTSFDVERDRSGDFCDGGVQKTEASEGGGGAKSGGLTNVRES